jgi:hypothetical protein
MRGGAEPVVPVRGLRQRRGLGDYYAVSLLLLLRRACQRKMKIKWKMKIEDED